MKHGVFRTTSKVCPSLFVNPGSQSRGLLSGLWPALYGKESYPAAVISEPHACISFGVTYFEEKFCMLI